MINPASVLSSWDRLTPKIKRLVNVFASPEGVGQRYLLGRNDHSAALSKVIDIDGFVDDFVESGTVWHGKPVLKGDDVPKHAIVVNCSMSIGPISAHKRIEKLEVSGVLADADLCKVHSVRFGLPIFVKQARRWCRRVDAHV